MPFDDSIITKASIASLARRPIRRSGFPLEGALERSHPSIVTHHLGRLVREYRRQPGLLQQQRRAASGLSKPEPSITDRKC